MFSGFEAQPDIGSYYDNGLASKVRVFRRCNMPTLVLDEIEKRELSHDKSPDTVRAEGDDL